MIPSEVIVIGGGVIGLTTAYTILSKRPNTSLLLVAAELPTDDSSSWSADYASMWAGAHYRPIAPATQQEHDEFNLALRTCSIMQQLARTTPESGVATMQAIEYMENPKSAELNFKAGDIYASEKDNFRVLDDHELSKHVRWGCSYQTYCANVTQYCNWLLTAIKSKGARIVQQKLARPGDAFTVAKEAGFNAKIVVNCSGRGFDDPKTFPIRGQTVLVKQQFGKTITRQCTDGTWAFLIPRPNLGGTIVGGTKEPRDWNDKPSLETRKKLLENAAKYFPEFVRDAADFEVLRDNVGRRPARQGGLRAEVEEVGNGKRIVHGYGAGGRGYELSWGFAERLVALIEENTPVRSLL